MRSRTLALHTRAHRRREGLAADSHGSRLVASLPAHDEALGSLKVKSAYLDGELCALNANGCPSSVGSKRQWTRQDRSTRVLRLRSSLPEWRERSPTAAD